MEIIKDIKDVKELSKERCVALGTFDGVHLGHQAVLDTLLQKSRELGLKSAIFTFSSHPLEKMVNKNAPPLLNTIDEKISILENLGVDELVLLDFTEEFAALSPEQFIEEYLLKRLQAKQVVVGFNYTFAKERKGKVELLRQLGERYNFAVEVVAPFYQKEEVVSSTRIRRLINLGKVEEANNILGYPYFLQGEVVHGYKKGREMGYPTANINFPPEKVIPANGVYAVMVEWKDKVLPAVTNIGFRPTFQGKSLSLEVHIFDFSGDLYGEELKVNFLKEIRQEKSFQSIDELISQIAKDSKIARRYLSNCSFRNFRA